MLKHLQLLGVLYFIWGGVFVLLGISFLALALGTAALVPAAETGGRFAAGLAATTFASLAGVTIIWGLVHGWDGVALRRHREWGRAVAMVLAILNLIVIPFGTALGIYALWVLAQDEIRPLFEAPRK